MVSIAIFTEMDDESADAQPQFKPAHSLCSAEAERSGTTKVYETCYEIIRHFLMKKYSV